MASWRSGGPFSNAPALPPAARELVEQAGQVFRSWQARLAELLAASGLAAADADAFATMLIAASEGAVVLARAQQDFSPFDAVHRQLRAMAVSYVITPDAPAA
jgi:TetR/AcrR family transcriptional repressor of lmrAB and yxaGH operons